MPRFVAFLRGVSPMNAKMPEVKRAFELAGFTAVKTLLSSGNVAFDARAASVAALARKAEAAMEAHLGRSFHTLVRTQKDLQDLVAADPFAAFDLAPEAKPIVTFLDKPYDGKLELPLARDGASIFAIRGEEVLSAYLPNPKGPLFMALLERTFGKSVTTRTWDTVKKCAKA